MLGPQSSAYRLHVVRGPRASALFLGAIACSLVFAGLGTATAGAAPTSMVNLGQASTYAALSGASVGNTVSAPGAPHTTLRGDLGVKANAQPTGFPPGVVTGMTRVGTSVDQAHSDVVAAYTEIAARTGGAPLAGALAGETISPGLHTIAGAASNTTTVTLDGGGDANAVFVFQVNGALAFAAGSHVVLAGGAQASRVFWQVNGAGAVGANADFAGTLIAMDAVALGANSVVNGRAFARNGALTLDNNQIYSAPPSITLAGGATDYTTDTTPTISGTTDVEAPGIVTVNVAGQTLTATPSNETWSVTSSILANATYQVVASVVDGAGNPGTATQELTVDTVLPVITLDNGSSIPTNDPTPTISGTSDVAVDTVVRVTVDSQNLRALVHSGGTWNVRPAPLADGARIVTAAVTDPAGNVGSDSEVLTIDTIAPAVTIAGGANALTNDATPEISGTAGVVPGTTVTVDLADETLTATVGANGGWSVTAAELSDGPHRIVISVSDEAGNRAGFSQTLTVDTVSPTVTIDGGETAMTHDLAPTIRGTSEVAPGTTVSLSIANQTITTLVQANGGWNATPDYVGEGELSVVASAPDPAGNVGSARQTLTVVDDSVPLPTDANPPPTTPPTGNPPGTTSPVTDPFPTPPATGAPETTITKRVSKTTRRTRVRFEFVSDAPASTFECKLDRRPFKPCSSPTKVKVGQGVHRFKVRATDLDGNADPTAASDRFRVARGTA